MHHLNHGSFGAVPLEVQARQTEWRARWEANTTAFVVDDLMPALDQARGLLAEFLVADPRGLVFVRNASQGVAAVVRSLESSLEPGDEIVSTIHDYNAVRQTLVYSAARNDVTVRIADVPFPIGSSDEVAEAVYDQVTDRTRLVVLDHITSPTGLVYPIDEIVSELEPEVPVLIDGAHGPGQVPLNLDALGASWYTGNLHKWVCAPKGSAFLHTRVDKLEETHPTVISHAWNTPIVDGSSRYQGLFDWTGTDDMTPWLVVPDAIRVVGEAHPDGWPGVMRQNHQLALAGRNVLLEMLDSEAPAPDDMVGALAAVPLPPASGSDPGGLLSPLNKVLLDEGYETLVTIWPEWPSHVLRASAHLYNEIEEYQALAETVKRLVA